MRTSLFALSLTFALHIALSGCTTPQKVGETPQEPSQEVVKGRLSGGNGPLTPKPSNAAGQSAVSSKDTEGAKAEETDATELVRQLRAELKSVNTKLRHFYSDVADDPAIQQLRQSGSDEDYYRKLYDVAKGAEESGQYTGITALLEKKRTLVARLAKAERAKSILQLGQKAPRVVHKRRARTHKPSSATETAESRRNERPGYPQEPSLIRASGDIAAAKRSLLPAREGVTHRDRESIAPSHGRRISSSGSSLSSDTLMLNSGFGAYRIGRPPDSGELPSGRRQTRIIRKISGRRIGSRRLSGSALGVPASKVFVRPVETRRQVVVREEEQERSLKDKAFSGSSPFVRPASSRVIVTDDWDGAEKGKQTKAPAVGPGRAFRVNPFGANAFGGIDETEARPSSKSIIHQNIQLRKELERRQKELEEREKRLEEERRRRNRTNVNNIRNRGFGRGRRF